MIRFVIILSGIAVLSGCQGQDVHTPIDPFFGQTKIAPPGTGQFTRQAAVDPYYRQSAATPPTSPTLGPLTPPLARTADEASAAPIEAVADSAAQAPQRPSAPGDRIEIPLTARREAPRVSLASTAAAPKPLEPATTRPPQPCPPQPCPPQRVVQTITPRADRNEPRPALYASPVACRPCPPPPCVPPTRTVDIMDLPPVDGDAATRPNCDVQFASATMPAETVTVRIPTRADATPKAATKSAPTLAPPKTPTDSLGRFGYSTDYRRLRGRLEYFDMERSWKIRYIPIDGETDIYGGSVIIDDPTQLSGLERGDFVEARGEVLTASDDLPDFAPTFRLTEIREL